MAQTYPHSQKLLHRSAVAILLLALFLASCGTTGVELTQTPTATSTPVRPTETALPPTATATPDVEATARALGFEADEMVQTGEMTIYKLNGVGVTVIDGEGKVTPMQAGFAKQEDGSFLGLNETTGKWEQAKFPGGTDPVMSIEQYNGPDTNSVGKVLGLNEYGWAVTEYKGGKWVPFVKELKFASIGSDINYYPNVMTSDILKPITAAEVVPVYAQQIYHYKTKMDFLDPFNSIPTEADGRVKFGFLSEGQWVPENLYSGIILGQTESKFGGIGLVVEIPFATQRQVLAINIPNQKGYSDGVYRFRQLPINPETDEATELEAHKDPIQYSDLVQIFVTKPGLRGRQIMFSLPDYDIVVGDRAIVRDQLFAALAQGLAVDNTFDFAITRIYLPAEAFER